jgi:hypothetical protein
MVGVRDGGEEKLAFNPVVARCNLEIMFFEEGELNGYAKFSLYGFIDPSSARLRSGAEAARDVYRLDRYTRVTSSGL